MNAEELAKWHDAESRRYSNHRRYTNAKRHMRFAALIRKQAEDLKPFAHIGHAFDFSVGPDGIDDDLTVLVYPHVRPELEQKIGTAAFTAARAARIRR